MKKALILCILLSNYFSFAQYEVIIEASILDKKTSEPIPYANIGFISKRIGTVSDEKGIFKLVYDEALVGITEELQISSLGYETLNVSAQQLVRLLKNTNKIFLKPKTESLNEVFLTNENREELVLGSSKSNKDIFGYWKDRKALGAEIANKINIRNKKTRLLNFGFYINDNQSDSLKIRVNIYDYSRRYPNNKILKNNLFYTIKAKEGEVKIDLEPYNIIVNNDIVVSIELIEVYGSRIEFALSGNQFSGPSFTRYVSQDKWERQSQLGMNFSILTSFPSGKKRDDFKKRLVPEKITLYWDASFFRDKAFIDKELEVLNSYLKTLKNSKVEIIVFNDTIVDKKEFEITRSSIKDVLTYLKKINFKGKINYDIVLKENTFNADAILLFTNGISLFSNLEPEINVPVFSINSSPNANHQALQKTAYYAEGHYINLQKCTLDKALECLEFEMPDRENYSNDTTRIISGIVSGGNGTLQGATVRVKNTLNEVQTDFDGQFTIASNEGDILEISHIGMLPKEIVTNQSKTININLKPDGELLDEVLLKAKAKQKAKEVITGYSKKNEDAIGYDVKSITSKDISPGAIFLSDAIRGRFAGVTVSGFGNDAVYIIRGINSINNPVPAAFEVNGILYSTPPDFVDVQQIESITVLKSVAATNKYGAIGAGGVFVVKMKIDAVSDNSKPINTALVKGNDYTEDLNVFDYELQKSNLTLKLENAKSYDDAIAIYTKLLKENPSERLPFYLDASDYFLRWDTQFSLGILEKATLIAYSNVKALKAVAYKLEEREHHEEAQLIYERIAVLKPNDLQSYRDLAYIYKASGKYKSSMKLYKRMIRNEIPNLDFVPIANPIINEIKNLVANHRLDVNYKDLSADLLSTKFNIDLRIVFEWNDPKTEFEFQFVNPQKKYYKWQHTLFDNEERLRDEIEKGYYMEEYIIDDAESGEWIINIEAFSKPDSINPSYLKYTVYKNYGLSNEEKTIKILKIDTQNLKVTLDKFNYK